ncbi:DUF952 domain-containing protein [Rhodopirellula sp. P2]|uniref:DUF952 domain-containing protein n=1 Tax=Rhodopirellula sp. P2 TaxID=2127060 RepID=UPI0023679AE1|nr:DUF952 domain-containing protein [Rhodopirellula sp. P2]WDQ14667.1 DUF952 domain-containing protein [Rhodopirellula sp. P2]
MSSNQLSNDPPTVVCKIATQQQWEQMQATGVLLPAPIDVSDGFIHLSSEQQVPGTLAAHFAGQTGLVVLHIRVAEIEANLRWEESRGGDRFPHLYAELPLSAVERVESVLT